MIKLLVLSDLTREPDRQLIRGVTSYSSQKEPWTLYMVSTAMRSDASRIPDVVEKARNLKVDAIFGAWPAVEDVHDLGLDIPMFLKPMRKPVKAYSTVTANNRKIGRMAADFFSSLDLPNVSYSGQAGMLWADERIRSFKAAMGRTVCPGLRFSDSQADYDRIAKWLRSLPKPVGIFATNDFNAGIVIEVCQSLGIRVPEDVAVLGVDDDTFQCSISSPAISTIRLDYEKAGFELAKQIEQCVDNHDLKPISIVHEPIGLIERGSTPSRSIRDKHVKAVVDFMESHFTDLIGIREAIEDVPLSRRSIEMRFKKEFGDVTMLDYLTNLRIARIKEFLTTTDLPLLEIAARSGFSESENIYRIFKKNVGCTPSEFRRIHKKEQDL